MDHLVEMLIELGRDVVQFVGIGSGLKLRKYQVAVAQAVIDSVTQEKGYSFVVIFPRQSGKNELQVQLQAYLLTLFFETPSEMVQISPTWRPQTENAMHKLEDVLSRNQVVHDRWSKSHGHVFKIGKSRLTFLSGSPTSNIVGATANLLLSIDEAQDVLISKYDKEIAPMGASNNTTRVFWGTAWTSNTLLAREEKAACALQAQDGVQRVFKLTCDDVAAEVPAYGKFVAEQVAKLGRHHPMVLTQYYSEEVDAEGGLFPPERLGLILGTHPEQSKPIGGKIYVMTLDVAGEEESPKQGIDVEGLNQGDLSTRRDATALTIARVNLSTVNDPGKRLPTYEIVHRMVWVGVRHTAIYSQILNLANVWHVRYLVCDATGVGAGLTSFLTRSLGEKVIPFTFNSKTKSDLGWGLLAMVDSGRLKTHVSIDGSREAQDEFNRLFLQQLEYCQYEIQPGPEKRIRWSVPDGTRDPGSGGLIHDDLVICAAMLSLLDGKSWRVTGSAAVVQARDPLDEMRRF